MKASSRSIERKTVATRPNASAAAQKTDDLTILRPLESSNDLNGIGSRVRVIEISVEPIKHRFEHAAVFNVQFAIRKSGLCDLNYDPAMRRALLKAFTGLLAMAVIAGVAVYLYVRRSPPLFDGDISVAGLSGSIKIVRDVDAVPHIFAATKDDALYGLGFVHAQDRLSQMEFQRHLGHGRLSEIFWAVTVPQDRFQRGGTSSPRITPNYEH